MNFEMSKCIAFETKQRKEASEFYKKVMGLKATDEKEFFTEFSNGSTQFFVVDQDKCPGLMLDFIVEDKEKAMEHLKANGCKIIQWQGKDKDCFVQDPFGLVFNLTQK